MPYYGARAHAFVPACVAIGYFFLTSPDFFRSSAKLLQSILHHFSRFMLQNKYILTCFNNTLTSLKKSLIYPRRYSLHPFPHLVSTIPKEALLFQLFFQAMPARRYWCISMERKGRFKAIIFYVDNWWQSFNLTSTVRSSSSPPPLSFNAQL